MTDEQRKRIHKITYSCDDRAELAERIVALEAENATLRQQLADATESMGRVEERCAKLRELVIEVFNCARGAADCEKCREKNDGYACSYVMQELGIKIKA